MNKHINNIVIYILYITYITSTHQPRFVLALKRHHTVGTTTRPRIRLITSNPASGSPSANNACGADVSSVCVLLRNNHDNYYRAIELYSI